MKLHEIKESLKASWLQNIEGQEDIEIERVGAADLLSDLLTLSFEPMLLVTGMTGVQTIRTAEMAENISAIVFVRGKTVGSSVIKIATSLNIPLLVTKHGMYETCGILYQCQLPSIKIDSHG